MVEPMTGIQLSEQQRFEWLRLIRTEGVGPKTFRSLINRFGGAGAALAALPDLAHAAGRSLILPPLAEIEREIEQGRRLGVRLVCLGELAYPAPLAASQTAPPVIAVRGSLGVLARPMVALVGSRNASALGMKFTEKLARELGEAGFVVVSGLARGIDAAAHRASCATGTVAVLAGGHGRVYPPQNEPLLEELLEHGAAISELPFAVEPRARDFPRRNRIVAALSRAVVVIEAARKSGSLITAGLALEEGRELFAVPGSPLDPRAEGTNDLLARKEVHMCRSAADVIAELEAQIDKPSQTAMLFDSAGTQSEMADLGLDELEWILDGADAAAGRPVVAMSAAAFPDADAFDLRPKISDSELAPSDDCILDLLGTSAVGVDDLVRHSQLTARIVQSALIDLEMRGLVRRDVTGGYVRV